jgi:hypothetical protein
MPRTRSYELPEYAVSDEAAARIADMLMEIALQFEETHFGQIHRYYQSLRPEPNDNSGQQLDLFHKGLLDPFNKGDKDPPF